MIGAIWQDFASRRFTEDDQKRFVAMTGDANPIHADPIAAAGMFPGGIIVHGVHGLMWSVDKFLEQNGGLSIRSFQATFLKPILLNEDVTASAQRTADGLRLKVSVKGVDVTTAKIALGDSPKPGEGEFLDSPRPLPPERRLKDLTGAAGVLTLSHHARQLAEGFPHLAAAVGPTVIAGLGALATLVGMECPGLYGVSTDIAVDISTDGGPLQYRVRRVDPRFSRAEIAVTGYGLTGVVGAFVNEPKPA